MLEFGKVKMTADARTQEARSFLKAAQWRVLTMRSTSAGKGAEGAVPRFRMRVYAKGCPVHALREVHLLLNADNPLADPVVDGVVQPGKWWHRGAGWSKDEGAGERGTGTCTLVRDLYDGEIADTQYLEDGCGSRTKVIFYFDTPSVISLADIAESGTQGFSVRLGGVSLDRETGLYSYYVTVTESKTLILDEHKVAEDAFRTRYDADYLGLRGTVASPTDSGGDAVAVPEPGVLAAGTLITAQWSRNREDCTLNAQVGKEVAIPVPEAAVSHTKTLYNEVESVSAAAASAKLGDAPAPAGGATKRHVSRLRPDEMWDTEVSWDQELPVSAASVRKSATVFGKAQTVVDRHQTALPPEPSAGSGVRVETSTERTPGALRNNTVSTETELPYENAQVSEKRTLFSRVLTKIAKSVSRSAPAAAASGGIGTSGSASVTPGGRNDLTEVIEEELPVPRAKVSRSATVFQTEETVVDAHSAGAAPDASAVGGVIVSADESLNPLGSKNIGVSTRTELPYENAQVSEKRTLFSRVLTKIAKSVSRGAAVPAASGGIGISSSASVTPGGRNDLTEVTEEELPVPRAQVRRSATIFETEETVTDVHSAGSAPDASAGDGVIVSSDESVNPLGSRNVGVSTRTELPVEGSQVQESMTVFGREVSTTSHNVNFDNELDAGGGVLKGGGRSLTPGGKKVTVKTERTETAYPESSVRDSVMPWATVRTTEDTHMPAPHGGLSGFGAEGYHVTPGGRYNRTKTELVAVNDGTILSHAKGGDRFSTWESYTTAESAKNFDPDVGLTNAGVPGAATIKTNEFSYDELGYYRKTTNVETVGAPVYHEKVASYFKSSTGSSSDMLSVSSVSGVAYNCEYTLLAVLINKEATLTAAAGQNSRLSVSASVNVHVNKFGLCSGTWRFVVAEAEKDASA
jgi:hypothetical protein